MITYSRLAIPAVAILAIGGVISFLLAYNFCPETHENVTIDGKCYELLGEAHKQYVHLAARKDIETLRLQLRKVEPKMRLYISSSVAKTLTSSILNINTR